MTSETTLSLLQALCAMNLPIEDEMSDNFEAMHMEMMADRNEKRIAELESALEFMLMAWDGDAEYRHYCGVGDEVSFPIYKGIVQTIEQARAVSNGRAP